MGADEKVPSETRLLHISDTHLGYIAYGESRRADDFADAFTQVVQLAIERNVDAVVHTGDLTHDADAASELQPRIAAGLRRLRAEEIPFYFILGNHDITNDGSPQVWAHNIVENNLGTRLSRHPIRCGIVSLYGIDYQERSWWDAPDLTVEDPVSGTIPILCLHQSVSPLMDNEISATTLSTVQTASSVAFDAVLLGHSHYTNTAEGGGLKAHYAGSTERTTRGYRAEPVGVTEFDVSEDGIDQIFHELDVRPFTTYTVNYPPACDSDQLEAAVENLDIDGEVVTLYTAGGVETSLVEQVFQAAGAFDTRAWPWDGDEEIPQGIARHVENEDGSTRIEPVTAAERGNDTPENSRTNSTGQFGESGTGDSSPLQADTANQTTDNETQSESAVRDSIIHIGSVRFGHDFDEPPTVTVEQAFTDVIDRAVEQSVAAIVITGGLFAPEPGSEAVDQCRDALSRAANASVSVILAPQSGMGVAAVIEELRQADLLSVASTDALDVGPFSIHGVVSGQEFSTELIGLSPENGAACNVLVSDESVTPPCAPESANWNYTQIRDLIDAKFDALLLNSGTGDWTHSDLLLAEGMELISPLDRSSLDEEESLGGYATLTLDGGEISVETHSVDSSPLISQEIAVESSATYEQVWGELDGLNVEGAHVRILLHGADETVRARVARELQRRAESVVIWDADDNSVTAEQTATAPGTDWQAVPGRDMTADEPPQVAPDRTFVQTPSKWGRSTGPDLVEEGFASVTDRDDGQCGFVFDISAWESAQPDDVSSHVDRSSLSYGKWYCHHDAADSRQTCPFHTPNDEIDSSEVRSKFLDTLENASSKRDIQFYGASLPSFVLSNYELNALQNYPIDVQHASVGHVRIENSRIDQPLQFDHSTLQSGVVISGTQVAAKLSLQSAHIDGSIKLEFTRLTESPTLTSLRLDGDLIATQSDLRDGIMLSGSQLTGRLRFSNCSVGGHATFYDIVVGDGVTLNRTHFTNECRYDDACIAGNLSLFDTSITQRFVLEQAMVGDAVTIDQSTFGSELDLSAMTGSTVTVRDSSLESTLVCRQSVFDAFTLVHTTVDGVLRLDRTECGRLRFDTVTCLDHVEISGDCVGDTTEPKTIHEELTVTNAIFHRPFNLREVGVGGACQLTSSVFHDEIVLADATLEEGLSLAQSTVKGSVTLDGVLDGAFELDNGTFEGVLDANGITDVGGPLTASHSSFSTEVDLRNTTFTEGFELRDADVAAPLRLDGCECHGRISFEDASFAERVSLDGLDVTEPASFGESIFDGEVTLVDFNAEADVDFENTRFAGRVTATGADIDGDLLLSNSRFDDWASLIGVKTGGDLCIENVVFADIARFEHVTVGESIDAAGVSFEGTASFEDATVGDEIDATTAMFDQEASFEGIETLSSAPVSFTEARFFGPVSFSNADFAGTLCLERVGTWAAADFTDMEVGDTCSVAHARFRSEARFCEATVSGDLDFSSVTADGRVDFTDAGLDGDVATFDRSRVGGTVTFAKLESDANLSLTDVSFHDDVRFDDAEIDGEFDATAATFDGRTSFTDCEFHDAAMFPRATFESDVRFVDTRFDSGASFENARIETPQFIRTRCMGTELDCSGAKLGNGQIVQPAGDPTNYNFTGSLLGTLTLGVADGTSIDVESFRLVSTRYDGFEFADHPPLHTVERSLERYAAPASDPSYKTLEKTYLKAKNGAGMVGDSDAAGTFFVRELRNRAKVHRATGRTWPLVKNTVLRATSNYGQSPARVFVSSLALIGGFGAGFYAMQLMSDAFPAEPGSTYGGFEGALLLSLEAFTTLVFGGVDVSNPAVRLVGAFEGFIGALMIALFLYALTQSIDR